MCPSTWPEYVARLLFAERCRRGTRAGTRALTCFGQAVLGLRWFRDRMAPDRLSRDHQISRATSYRYLDEVIAVLAEQAPDIHQVLQHAQDQGLEYVILDGSVLSTDRCSEETTSTQGYTIDAWYSEQSWSARGKHPSSVGSDRHPAVDLARRTRLERTT